MTAVQDRAAAETTAQEETPRVRRARGRGRRPAGTARPARAPRAPLPPRAPEPEPVTVVSTALLVVAALAAWAVLQVLLLGGLSHARAQDVLRSELREQLAAQTAPTGGVIEPGSPVALLAIPTLGLEEVVVEGTAASDTMAGPGHRRDTALPGQVGVSIVYGRATAYGAPFRAVPLLREGDGIVVTTAQGEFTYRVDGVRREGDPLPPVPADGGARLTLVTTEGSGPLAALTQFTSVYVDATLVGDAAVGPAGRPATIPEAEKAMNGDLGALPVLVLALQGLLLGVVGAALLRGRLPGRAVWVLAGPVVAAFAWWSTDTAARLLPNLF